MNFIMNKKRLLNHYLITIMVINDTHRCLRIIIFIYIIIEQFKKGLYLIW